MQSFFKKITISVYSSSHQSPKSCHLQGSETLILFKAWFANMLPGLTLPLAVLATQVFCFKGRY